MLKLIYIVITIAIISSMGSIFFYHNKVKEASFKEIADWGAFGDFFGGVLNPTFTFLSIILLAYTLYQNKKSLNQANESLRLGQDSLQQSAESLKQNQKALEINTKELNISSTALESSSEALHSQTIGNVFFSLLEQHNNIVNNLNWKVKSTQGRMVFSRVIQHLQEGRRQYPIDTYTKLQREENHILGHYFRNLFQIIKYIDEYSDLETDTTTTSGTRTAQKKNFMRILRAQLSSDELAVLFFNCMPGVVDGGQFKDLLIKYKMLKHIQFDLTASRTVNFKNTEISKLIISKKDLKYYFDSPGESAFDDNPTVLQVMRNK